MQASNNYLSLPYKYQDMQASQCLQGFPLLYTTNSLLLVGRYSTQLPVKMAEQAASWGCVQGCLVLLKMLLRSLWVAQPA